MREKPLCVVVAYGRPDLLASCLASLSWADDVAVVDNGRDEKVRAVADRHGATYLPSERNLGFAAGVNRGLGLRRPGQDALLVNPDSTLSAADADLLREALSDGRVGAVAPRLVRPDGRPERTTWPLPSPLVVWAGLFGLADVLRRPSFLSGAVLLLRAEAVDSVGLFDERFFLYSEEADWQRRALDAGWKLTVCDAASAVHVGAATSSDPLLREAYFHTSAEQFARKWFGDAGWLCFRSGALLAALRRWGGARERQQRAVARYVVGLYLRGPARASRAARGAEA